MGEKRKTISLALLSYLICREAARITEAGVRMKLVFEDLACIFMHKSFP